MNAQQRSEPRSATGQAGELEQELERRLAILETEEAADPVHAKLGGRDLAIFLGVVGIIAVAAWIGAAL